MISTERIVNHITKQVEELETQHLRKVCAGVLGIKLDSWGKVTAVDENLITKISATKEAQFAVTELIKLTKEEIEKKPFNKNQILQIVREWRTYTVRNMIQTYLDDISSAIEKQIKPHIEEQVREQISHDKNIAPYIALDNIFTAVNTAKTAKQRHL